MEVRKFSFFQKEVIESIRTSRFVVLMALFLFFGITSPLLARYMVEIFAWASPDLPIVIPDPNFLDSWVQIYKNITSLAMIIFLVLISGMVVREKVSGSILLVLTKRVSRLNFLLSKFFAAGLLFSVCYIASVGVSIAYTQILFNELVYDGMIASLLLIYFMGLTLSAIAVFVSTITKSQTTAALLGFLAYSVLSMFNLIPGIIRYNPLGAASMVNSILLGEYLVVDVLVNIIVMMLFSSILLFITYSIFKKQEL
jgi:ABC-2 type transport system permease protein